MFFFFQVFYLEKQVFVPVRQKQPKKMGCLLSEQPTKTKTFSKMCKNQNEYDHMKKWQKPDDQGKK